MHYTSREVYEFVSTKLNDPIIERRTCAVSGAAFPIYASDDAFYAKISPTFDGKKFSIPRPTLCPEERQRRRLAFRNERKLYKRKCDATGESMVSIYSPDKRYKVFHKDYRWSDKREGGEGFGQPFDGSIPFFQQCKKLYENVPRYSLNLMGNENTEYGNDVEQAKNCYMIFNAWDIEDSYYASAAGPQARAVLDAYRVNYSEVIYEGVYLVRCNNVFYSSYCNDCSFCWYCVDCQGCQNCYDCCDLQNKQYCIGNQQYTAETYHDALAGYQLQNIGAEYAVERIVRSENVFGNNIIDSGNCGFCYGMVGCNDCRYTTDGLNFDTALDTTNCGTESTHVYESIGSYFITYSGFTIACNKLARSRYCIDCYSCSDCFGCVGLRNKQYYIFNKQYAKEEYEKEVAKIVAHMQETGERGRFFDQGISSFGYNETVAMEYMPLQREEALHGGYAWQTNNYDPVAPATSRLARRSEYDDAGWAALLQDDNITNTIFICEETGRPFRIIPQEVAFYKKHNLQIPSFHPDVRHLQRIAKRQKSMTYLYR